MELKDFCHLNGITEDDLWSWTEEFLNSDSSSDEVSSVVSRFRTQDSRDRIVLEALNGESSVAEICNKFDLSHETFLSWSRDFLSSKSILVSRQFKIDKLESRLQFLSECLSPKLKRFLQSYVDVYTPDVYFAESPLGPPCSAQWHFADTLSDDG